MINPAQIETIAFDVDGTLFSSEDIILDTYIQAIQDFASSNSLDIQIPSHSAIMNEIGKPVKTIFQNLLPMLAELQRDTISDSVLEILCQKIQAGQGEVYEGTAEVLRFLHSSGKILLAASNGRRPYIEAILRYSGVYNLFDPIVVINGEGIQTKGDILRQYVESAGHSAERMLMIGDRASDREAADSVGALFAFCRYGHANPGEVERFDLELHEIRDLIPIFSQKNSK